jgi:hypothetical protein
MFHTTRQPRGRFVALSLAAALLGALAVVVAPVAAGSGDANGSTYVLTSFDGTSLLGLNAQGKTFYATLDSGTAFKFARIDRYQPGDPCRTVAESWNNVVTSDGYASVLAGLVTYGCKAKVLIAVSQQQLPPSPIKAFQPTA